MGAIDIRTDRASPVTSCRQPCSKILSKKGFAALLEGMRRTPAALEPTAP